MAPLDVELGLIKQKFPGQSDQIEELYETVPDFRTLCDDYFLCIQYLRKFQKEFGEKQDSVEEYQSLRKELEKELSGFIFNEG
jgi:hypothetical protein